RLAAGNLAETAAKVRDLLFEGRGHLAQLGDFLRRVSFCHGLPPTWTASRSVYEQAPLLTRGHPIHSAGWIRRMKTRKPVCPTMVCSGRTLRPETFHSRTRNSFTSISANRPVSRAVSTVVSTCGTVGRYAQSTPP